MCIIRSYFYRHALADVFQVADFFIIWLHPRAGKMKGVLHSDWLPLGLSTSCSRFSKKFPVILSKSCSKNNQRLFVVTKVAQKLLEKAETFFSLMLEHEIVRQK